MHIVHETKKYNRDKGKKNDRKAASEKTRANIRKEEMSEQP